MAQLTASHAIDLDEKKQWAGESCMPTVFRWKGYKFLFFSLDEGEPPHVHVTKGSGQAKFWLSDCRLAKSRGFGEHELRAVRRKIEERREDLLRVWHEHFGTRG